MRNKWWTLSTFISKPYFSLKFFSFLLSKLCEATKQTDVDWYNSCEKLAPGDNIKFDDQSKLV